MGRPLFEILEGWLLLWSPSPRFETQYDYFVKASQSQLGFRRGRLALLWPPPTLFETKDYYFEIAKTMEGRSLFLSMLQPSGGLGQGRRHRGGQGGPWPPHFFGRGAGISFGPLLSKRKNKGPRAKRARRETLSRKKSRKRFKALRKIVRLRAYIKVY